MNHKEFEKSVVDFNSYPTIKCPMGVVNRWYFDNKEYAETEDFYFPLQKGKIEFDDDEFIKCYFYVIEDDGDWSAVIFIEFMGLPIIGWDFHNPITHRGWKPKKEDIHYLAKATDFVQNKTIQEVQDSDFIKNTNKKIWRVMQYANLYREFITSKESMVESTKKVWNGKKYKKQTVTLHSKVYTLPQLNEIPKHHKYTRPTEEVSVRGFWRHYKNGKKTWVKPFSKYTNESERKSAPTYIL